MDAKVDISRGPRSKPYANAPGSYEVAIRLATPILDPGDVLRLEVFLTGYGEIYQAKLFFFPSDAVFDPQKSWAESGIKMNHHGSLAWGSSKDFFLNDDTVGIIAFKGIQNDGWTEATSFFDVDGESNVIITEMKSGGKPPLGLSLQTRKSVRPGKYYIEFCFTYYDSQKWRSGTKRAEFTVRNFFERHQQKVATWGILASVLGLALGAARFLL